MAVTAADIALYPWNETVWQRLARDWTALPHALLLTGARGLGKHAFGLRLAHTLLCAQPQPDGPCLTCKSCQLFAVGGHPDFLALAPLEDARQIVIDQVRGVIEFMTMKPHTAQRKVVLLAPAETLNTHAANGLLKVLEEPPPGNHLLLVTDRPGSLPATLRSRCPRVVFNSPTPAFAQDWLLAQVTSQPLDISAAAGLLASHRHAPLAALAAAEAGESAQNQALFENLQGLTHGRGDPLALAAQWKKIAAPALTFLQNVAADLIRVKLAAKPDYLPAGLPGAQLQALNERLHLRELFDFFEVVSRNRRLCAQSLDEQLLLEEALICWTTRVMHNAKVA